MVAEKAKWRARWLITRYRDQEDYEAGRSYSSSIVEQNLLLNEGIQLMLDLLIGAGGTAFTNATSYLGVGDSSTAAAATQTALQASTNKAYVGMESTYPSRSNQTLSFRAIFDGDTGNFDWEEFTVANSNSDAGVNLNRKVDSQGTKAAGQIWTLDLTVTIS